MAVSILPFVLADGKQNGRSHAERLTDVIGPSLSVGFIYSVYEDAPRNAQYRLPLYIVGRRAACR